MPKKRYSDEDIESYVDRKMRKIERKLRKRRAHRLRSSSQDSLKILDEPHRTHPGEERSSSLALTHQPNEAAQNIDHHVVDDAPLNDVVNISEQPPDLSASIVPDTAAAAAQVADNDTVEDSLPDDILEILGEAPINDKKFGPPLNSNLAIRWEHTATNGLSKEARKQILDKHSIPQNCKNIDAPALNQEVKAALSEVLSKKDKAIENKQKQIALIIACVGDALSQILSTDSTNISLIKSLTDAGKLACDLQHTESMIRRSFVCSSIKKEIKDHLYEAKIDSHLFGSQLGDLLKTAKAINKTGAEMKTVAPIPGPSRRLTNQTQNLNSRRPLPPMSRQTGVAARRSTAPAPTRPEYPRQQRRAPPPPRPQPSAPYRRSQTHAPHRR
nr:uncharacterized protein LOC110383415 [Helicoverpa armigera]